MKFNHISAFLLLAIGVIFGFSISIKIEKPIPTDSTYPISADTLIIHDTITIDRPIFQERKIIDTILVTTLETDTVYLSAKEDYRLIAKPLQVSLPIEQKYYSYDNFDAWVSGFNAQLDSFRVYPKTKMITIEKRIHRQKKWSLGIHAGYGASKHGLTPYIGVGISYNLISF